MNIYLAALEEITQKLQTKQTRGKYDEGSTLNPIE